MESYVWTALVSLAALLVYLGMGVNVGRTRYASGIHAPAMTGDPKLERAIRVHYNTLEWLAPFLISLWIFALAWSDGVAALIGLVWILGRIIYAFGYMRDPLKRAPGFLIQFLAVAVLLFGAAGRLIYLAATGASA